MAGSAPRASGATATGAGTGHSSALVVPLVVFCVACALYSNALTGDFVFDDLPAVVDNRCVRPELSSWTQAFRDNFWGQTMGDPRSQHHSYRPVTTLTFRLNYILHGLSPVGYHATNVLLHGVASALVAVVSRALLVDVFGPAHISAPASVPLGAGLLFSLHPVHVEAVANVVGRAEILCGVFFLLALLAYMRACTGHMAWLLPSFLATGLAVLSKEQGITVVAVCLVYDLFVAQAFDARAFLGLEGSGASDGSGSGAPHETKKRTPAKRRKRAAPTGRSDLRFGVRQVLVVAFVAVVMNTRLSLNRGDHVTMDIKTNPANHIEDFGLRALTKSHYVALHAWLLVWPSCLCCDWSSFAIPNVNSLGDPRNLGTATMYLVLGALGLFGLFAPVDRRARAALLVSLSISIASFLPASGLLLEVGFVVAERILYSPSIGFCMLLPLLLWWASQDRKPLWRGLQVLVVVMLAGYAARSLARNADWQSEQALYESGVAALPNNAKLQHNYARSIMETGDPAKVEHHFREAIRIYPPYASAYVNLGVLLARNGGLEEAVEVWKDGLVQWETNPILGSDPVALSLNAGLGLRNLGRGSEAIPYLRKCLQYDPNKEACQRYLRELGA